MDASMPHATGRHTAVRQTGVAVSADSWHAWVPPSDHWGTAQHRHWPPGLNTCKIHNAELIVMEPHWQSYDGYVDVDTSFTLIYHPIFSRWVKNTPPLPPALCIPPYPLPSSKKYSKLFSPALILSAPCASSALCTPQNDCWSKPGKIQKLVIPIERGNRHMLRMNNTYIHACTHVHTHTPHPPTSHTHTNKQHTPTCTHTHTQTTQHTLSPHPPQPTNITSALQRSAVPKIGNFRGSHGACRWRWYQGRLRGWFTATGNAAQTLH